VIHKLVGPETEEEWTEIQQELVSSTSWAEALTDMHQQCENLSTTRPEAQHVIDSAFERLDVALNSCFTSHKLKRKRNAYQKLRPKPAQPHSGILFAPPQLRELRLQAARAKQRYQSLLRASADPEQISLAKHSWNSVATKCRKISKKVRGGTFLEWTRVWEKLWKANPRKMWSTFRSLTQQPSQESTCLPDKQFDHWATQGDIVEPVWDDSLMLHAEAFIQTLQTSPLNPSSSVAPSQQEMCESRDRLKVGRSPGIDGITCEICKHVPALTDFFQIMFGIMLKWAVYPQALGIALVRSILKPGKPISAPSSLRGIRLLSCVAAWFGQILDSRIRNAWQPGEHQFGFRRGCGCLEAVFVLLALVHDRTSTNKRLYVAWIDLRTAFPSLNRGILIMRLAQCGIESSICKLLCAIFECTRSIVYLGTLISHPFVEKLGVREGAVESPHLFNAYIDPIRQRLEAENPNLCSLLGVTLAILLYADDAALPADDIVSLQRSLDIFTSFCNEHRLYISVPKSSITVFHACNDSNVDYQNGSVFVDGVKQSVHIYGQELSASSSFKYLGIVVDSTGAFACHAQSRLQAFAKASRSLHAGLLRLPAFSFQFFLYLWSALVFPVLCYGVEVFAWHEDDVNAFARAQVETQKRCLGIGGRAPKSAVHCITGLDCCTLEWRVRRLGFFFRLVSSPPDSWQHLALWYHRSASSAWFEACVQDLADVLPNVNLLHGFHTQTGQDFLYSAGFWSEEGCWMSAQPFSLSRDLLGRPCCSLLRQGPRPHAELTAIRKHIRCVTQEFRLLLRRRAQAVVFDEVSQRSHVDAFAKTAFLCTRLTTAGPSIPCLLDFVHLRAHRQAICTLFSGDWFLGRYTGNYFARDFIPSNALQAQRAQEHSVDCSRVCIHCWHSRRELFLEDELHVLLLCPRYRLIRTKFVEALSNHTRACFHAAEGSRQQLETILASNCPQDWHAFGQFTHCVRRSRRSLRRDFEERTRKLAKHGFITRRAAWRSKGLTVCRHGVFFKIPLSAFQCPCMLHAPNLSEHWEKAVLMPAIDADLRRIVAVPFEASSWQRLRPLQNTLRAQDAGAHNL